MSQGKSFVRDKNTKIDKRTGTNRDPKNVTDTPSHSSIKPQWKKNSRLSSIRDLACQGRIDIKTKFGIPSHSEKQR